MDYLDRLETDNVPETWHDYKPSHFKRPLYLILAAAEVDQAWKAYDAVIELEIFATVWHCKPQYELVTAAREIAEQAAAHYSEQWERWQKELAEKLEVEG